ncbi:MAG: O-antigen ligase family protein [Vampirovibrionales bacterium]|nr:O-antigen ligase family protein [Vampirovibrionales bacterium]
MKLYSILNDSLLWGPVARWATTDAPWHQLWQTSMLGKASAVVSLASARLPLISLPGVSRLAQRLLMLGWAGLFALLTVCDTGIIGAVTLALFALSLLLALLGKHQSRDAENKAMGSWVFTLPDALILGFVGVAVLATVGSTVQPQSAHGLLKLLTLVAGYAGMRMALAGSSVSQRVFWITTIALLGLIQGGLGVLQSQQHVEALATWVDPDTLAEQSMTRVYGTLLPLNPNLYAGFLLPCLPAVALLAVWIASGVKGLGVMRQKPMLKILMLLLGGASFGLSLLGIVLSGSRGGYLGLLGAGLTAFVISGLWVFRAQAPGILRRLWLSALGLVLGGLVLALSLSAPLRVRVLSIGALWEDSSIAYRLQVYQSVWRMIQEHWLLGIGPGNETFRQLFGVYAPANLHALGAYSVPLEFWLELGVFGLLLMLALLSVLKCRTLCALEDPLSDLPDDTQTERLAADAGQALSRLILVAGWVAVVAMMAHGLFDTVFFRPSVQLMFWFWVALHVDASCRLNCVSKKF